MSWSELNRCRLPTWSLGNSHVRHSFASPSSASTYLIYSALYRSLLTHHYALKSLHKAHLKHLERENQLGDILEALKVGYNPNYQDMAVLEAVRGWEALSEAKNEESAEPVAEAVPGEGDWTEMQLDQELDGLLAQDPVALLGYDSDFFTQEPTSLCSSSSYFIYMHFDLPPLKCSTFHLTSRKHSLHSISSSEKQLLAGCALFVLFVG